jgi:sulfatase maturation enzyme AslB (radical SAM superfamily)
MYGRLRDGYVRATIVSPVRNDSEMKLLSGSERKILTYFGVNEWQRDTSNWAERSTESGLLCIFGCSYCYYWD